MTKRAIVVVDWQNEYLPIGKLPLHAVDVALDRTVEVLASARARGETVVHIRHEQPGAPIFVPGSEGADIIPAVAPAPGERVIVKNHPNAFRDTDLQRVLDQAGIEQVVLVGAMSHMCIGATARAATDLGYDTLVVEDACATMDLEHGGLRVPAPQVHAANMAAIAFAHGRIVSAEEMTSA